MAIKWPVNLTGDGRSLHEGDLRFTNRHIRFRGEDTLLSLSYSTIRDGLDADRRAYTEKMGLIVSAIEE
jgi:hypothetical protein